MLSLRQRTGMHLLLCAVLLFVTASGTLAADQPAEPVGPSEAHDVDDNLLEVGVWYVVDYENCGGWGLGDLPATAPDALGLRNRLTAQNYFFFFPFPTPRWNAPIAWGNGNAWERDWKRAALGGLEESQIDSVDFAYFAGHGAASGIFFGVGGNTRHDCQTTKNDSFQSWGTRDNDWIGLAACNVLDDPFSNLQGWANSMNGTRLLMGFQTVMSDVDLGTAVGWHTRWNKNFTQAWFTAVDEKLPQGQVARILAEDSTHFNDKWFNHNTPTIVDNTFWWWTHPAGSEPARAVNVDRVLQDGMPIFQVAPLSLEAADGRFDALTSAFNLTDTEPITGVVAANDIDALSATNSMYLSADADLQMDASAGNFIYVNSDELWSESAVQRAVAAASAADTDGMLAISQEDARGIADQFLTSNGLMPNDAQFYEVLADTLTMAEDTARGAAGVTSAGTASILSETPTNYQVIYSRILTYQPSDTGAAGVQQPINFSVIGPGAKLKVYVATQAAITATASSLVQDSVQGGVGGYREVAPVMAASGDSQLTTPILPTDTIRILFDKIEERVALSHVPLPVVSKAVISETLAYWEGPIGWNQDQLIPVWALTVNGVQADGTTQQYHSYIPVNSEYMAPYAEIIPPANLGATLPGMTLALEAADASQTLSALGVDDALDFALGTGNPDSYLYQWYLGSVAPENSIGAGRTLNYVVPDAAAIEGKPAEVRIILVVTDSLSPRDPKVATDEVILNFSKLYLPTIEN